MVWCPPQSTFAKRGGGGGPKSTLLSHIISRSRRGAKNGHKMIHADWAFLSQRLACYIIYTAERPELTFRQYFSLSRFEKRDAQTETRFTTGEKKSYFRASAPLLVDKSVFDKPSVHASMRAPPATRSCIKKQRERRGHSQSQKRVTRGAVVCVCEPQPHSLGVRARAQLFLGFFFGDVCEEQKNRRAIKTKPQSRMNCWCRRRNRQLFSHLPKFRVLIKTKV